MYTLHGQPSLHEYKYFGSLPFPDAASASAFVFCSSICAEAHADEKKVLQCMDPVLWVPLQHNFGICKILILNVCCRCAIHFAALASSMILCLGQTGSRA